MRNQNGGFLIVGLNDRTLQPDVAGKPANSRDTFHVDKIQQIVSRFAHDAFEIEVGYGVRDGIDLPVIAIPPGIQYPVASKADLAGNDGKKLVRFGDVYCRTLNSNGRVSTAVAQPNDWRDIFDRCFDNREADIGAFLRRHLGPSAEKLLTFGTQPRQNAQTGTLALLDEGRSYFEQASADLKGQAAVFAKNGAKFEVALVIDPVKQHELPTLTFRHTVSSANPNLTGWPIWLDSSSFADEKLRPVVRDGRWEALIIAMDHFDFEVFDPNGRFYLLRVLQDDISKNAPPAGTALDPILTILRVAESIAVGLSFARSLGWSLNETTLGFAFRWTGLAGRQLQPWANPDVLISSWDKTGSEAVVSYVEVPADTPLTAITPAVETVVRNLFVQFGGYQFPTASIEGWVRRLIERRL
ncbi:hypothetical protein [Bradyrhizobium sp. USDA 4454]